MIGPARRTIMRRLTDTTLLPVSVLLVILAVSGCANGDPAGQPSGSPSVGGGTVTSTPDDLPTSVPGNPGKPPTAPATEPPVKGGPPPSVSSGTMTLTGTVTAGVEPNCLLLDGYLLVGGPRDVVRSGARVTVTGRVQPDLMTTCQQGTPLVVESARSA